MDNYDAYLLTVKEAAKYFRIGENRLRRYGSILRLL